MTSRLYLCPSNPPLFFSSLTVSVEGRPLLPLPVFLGLVPEYVRLPGAPQLIGDLAKIAFFFVVILRLVIVL